MYALEIKDLKKTYSNNVEALKGIDLNVSKGDFFALLGPNGAGKSTVIGIICSLVNKSSGQVKVCGTDIDENFSLAKSKLGVVNQEFNFSQFEKVIDIIVTQAGYIASIIRLLQSEQKNILRSWDCGTKETIKLACYLVVKSAE